MTTIGPEILGRLLDEHGAALVLYAQQWSSAPEDAVQDAFLTLVRQPVLPEHPVAWLYRVVRNEAISASRSAGRRARREAAVAHRGEPWFQSSPGDRLDGAAAKRALEELPIHERETIVARLWGGLSFDQIAHLMGASTSSVHRYYQRGLERLREGLNHPCPTSKSRSTT